MRHVRAMATLETLVFDNAALRELPVDTITENTPRQVRNACFSRVSPTPLASPITVAYSESAMKLLGLPKTELDRPEFPSYLCGSTALSGAEYAAHCYCGHQFGYFSGQLGDGATMYVGEVLNGEQQRWEIQFKGAGKTPFSRSADGRKVLRSSIREFLCSEAMFHLGVPTTRAGSCVVSERDTVVRDILYDGHPRHEKCTVILRIAPTFLRFGSFEIFKTIDRITSRQGPSVGKKEILRQMIDYVTRRFFPELRVQEEGGGVEDEEGKLVAELYREIMERTARLVAKWQTVGFCHGVLNTDNMSILGLTIDYGPYSFMETFDPGFVCNGSDDGARYTYEQQPAICKWNVKKLGEMFALVCPQATLDTVLEKWESLYTEEYLRLMREKLGLLTGGELDTELVESLFEVMQATGSDFTNTFRLLQSVDLGTDGFDLETVVATMLTNCLSREESRAMIKTKYSKADAQALYKIVQQFHREDGEGLSGGFNPLAMYGINPGAVVRDFELHLRLEQLGKIGDTEFTEQQATKWREWITKYQSAVRRDSEQFTGEDYWIVRQSLQERVNPVVIPRNHVLQRAIDSAERGDYSVTRRLLEVFECPFTLPGESWISGRNTRDKAACVVT